MGRGLDGVVSPSTKNLSFAACEPFFSGYAKLSDSLAGKGLFRYDLRNNEVAFIFPPCPGGDAGERRPH
jgi:hypothetical protein